jgi:hypothetical protein
MLQSTLLPPPELLLLQETTLTIVEITRIEKRKAFLMIRGIKEEMIPSDIN